MLFIVNASLADDDMSEFQRENLFELMAYGAGVAEAITDLGEKTHKQKNGFAHGEEYAFSVVTETVSGISAKTVQKQSGELVPMELEVNKLSFRLPFGGTLSSLTAEEVISTLGQPAEKSITEFKYFVPSHMDDYVLIIAFEKEKAKSIRWVWWEI